MRIQRRARVPYSVDQMYALVHDIESYPQFLPEISKVRVIERLPDSVSAELEIHKGPVRETFATRNRLKPPGWMSMELLRGPFKRLHGEWHFNALEQGSEVCFELDFEVRGFALRLLLEPLVGRMADRLVDRFSKRATTVYG
jgi:ribosome-associated toxin RatA of RatAB toxin-antitoxin module